MLLFVFFRARLGTEGLIRYFLTQQIQLPNDDQTTFSLLKSLIVMFEGFCYSNNGKIHDEAKQSSQSFRVLFFMHFIG